MGLRDRIPFTQARRDRLFHEIMAKEVGDADGLALVEWEDGSISMRPVVWESDLSMLHDPETDDFWFARGRGAEPKQFAGVRVWHVYAGNAGVISSEACLIADQERYGDVIDVGAGDEIPDELLDLGLDDPRKSDGDEVAEAGDRDALHAGNGHDPEALADGAAVGAGAAGTDIDDSAAIYDLRPPEGYDGVAIDVRDPDDYDPYPVTREDAKAAAEWFERAVDDGTDTWMKGFIVGIVVTVILALIFLGGPWLAGQIAGGGGGGGGETITGMLWLAVGGAGLRDRLRWW
jgi:hypothetical protein